MLFCLLPYDLVLILSLLCRIASEILESLFFLFYFSCRMTRGTFDYIVTQLRPHLEKQDTSMRKCITVEHRLAITLWRLATNCEYRTLGHLFGVGTSTVCKIVHETCHAIEDHLMPQYIFVPRGRRLLVRFWPTFYIVTNAYFLFIFPKAFLIW